MKEFHTLYTKKRGKFNPLRYILGKYKTRFFPENKQPKGYKNSFEMYAESIDLNTEDIKII